VKMIAVFDSTPKAEQPLKTIEKIPEGADPDDVFNVWLKAYDGLDQMGYMFVHPALGAYVQAVTLPNAGSDSVAYALNQYKMELCNTIKVDQDFEMTQEECLAFFKDLTYDFEMS